MDSGVIKRKKEKSSHICCKSDLVSVSARSVEDRGGRTGVVVDVVISLLLLSPPSLCVCVFLLFFLAWRPGK